MKDKLLKIVLTACLIGVSYVLGIPMASGFDCSPFTCLPVTIIMSTVLFYCFVMFYCLKRKVSYIAFLPVVGLVSYWVSADLAGTWNCPAYTFLPMSVSGVLAGYTLFYVFKVGLREDVTYKIFDEDDCVEDIT